MPKKHSPPKAKPTPKAFDVFRPGKALASPTSRPVIAGHKPVVHDSTVTNKPRKPMAKARNGDELLDSHDKVTIPPPAAVEPAPESPVPQLATPTEPVIPPVEEKPTELTTQAEAEPEVPVEPSLQLTADEPDAPAYQEPEQTLITQTEESVSPVPEQPEPAPGAATPDQDATIPDEPVVDPAQIVVSHHKPVGQSKWKGVFVVLLIIILAAVAADVLLDAGVWTPNSNIPHTHFLNR